MKILTVNVRRMKPKSLQSQARSSPDDRTLVAIRFILSKAAMAA